MIETDNGDTNDDSIITTTSTSNETSAPLIHQTMKKVTEEPAIPPPVTTSSSDSVPLVQPPVATSSSDSVPLVQPPVATSSSDSVPLSATVATIFGSFTLNRLIMIQYAIPDIDESLLDNFDISKNTSDTGIENLTTAFDQGGELFIDNTEIDSQEEEFIEEANQVNEEVQIEEVQQEQKVEVVIEAQLSASTLLYQIT